MPIQQELPRNLDIEDRDLAQSEYYSMIQEEEEEKKGFYDQERLEIDPHRYHQQV